MFYVFHVSTCSDVVLEAQLSVKTVSQPACIPYLLHEIMPQDLLGNKCDGLIH
jgi:hypothetical protein